MGTVLRVSENIMLTPCQQRELECLVKNNTKRHQIYISKVTLIKKPTPLLTSQPQKTKHEK